MTGSQVSLSIENCVNCESCASVRWPLTVSEGMCQD